MFAYTGAGRELSCTSSLKHSSSRFPCSQLSAVAASLVEAVSSLVQDVDYGAPMGPDFRSETRKAVTANSFFVHIRATSDTLSAHVRGQSGCD